VSAVATEYGHCGGELVAGILESVLTSQRYLNDYSYNLTCNWEITAPVGHRVELRLTDINIGGRFVVF